MACIDRATLRAGSLQLRRRASYLFMKLHAYFRSRDAWVIRRKSARDFVGDSLELRGPILWCFSDDVVQQAFDVDGYAGGSYPSPDESSRQNANASMSRVVEVKPWVFECKSPLQDREEFRAAQGLPEQFPNPDDAKRIFRFDDLTTELMGRPLPRLLRVLPWQLWRQLACCKAGL